MKPWRNSSLNVAALVLIAASGFAVHRLQRPLAERVARLPGEKATVITTTRGASPRLYALTTETGVITSYDAGPKPKKLGKSTPFSEFGTQLDAQ